MRAAIVVALVSALAACGGKSSARSESKGTGLAECDQFISLQRSCASRLPEGDPGKAHLTSEANKLESDLHRGGFGDLPDSDPDKQKFREICADFLKNQGEGLAECKH
jgi:hypothetical protein